MYKNTEIKGYAPALESHHIYFIQRWGELLDKSNLHYRKLIKPCVRAVLKEAISTIEYYKQRILRDYNIFEILDETVDTLKSSTVLKSFYSEDFNIVIENIQQFISNKKVFVELKTDLEKYKKLDLPYVLIKGLFNKLENVDISKVYADRCKAELAQSKVSYDLIDDLVVSLISELIYEGHHRQYLYNWGMGVFIKDAEPDLFKRIDRIRELGRKNKRMFECFIKIKLPEGYQSIFQNVEGKINFYDKPEDLRVKFGEEYSLEGVHLGKGAEFFKTEKDIARIKIIATDDISAINTARKELMTTTKLFALETKHRQYDPGNLTETMIFDPDGNYLNLDPTIETSKQGLQITKSEEYIKINISDKPQEKYQGLNQILQWCRIIQDSPKETGLVAMWSLLEFLFVIDPMIDKRQNVREHALPYVCQFYFKSLSYQIRDLLEYNKDEYAKILMEVKDKYGYKAVDNRNRQIKLHYLNQFFTEEKEKANEIYDGKILEQRYIGMINKFMQLRGKKLWFSDYLEEMEKQVRGDLMRAYRVRNILAHHANINDELLEEIYDIIAYYLKLILDDLLYSMKEQPSNSINDIVKIKKESYRKYAEYLKHVDKKEDIDYKKCLSTKSLLI